MCLVFKLGGLIQKQLFCPNFIRGEKSDIMIQTMVYPGFQSDFSAFEENFHPSVDDGIRNNGGVHDLYRCLNAKNSANRKGEILRHIASPKSGIMVIL